MPQIDTLKKALPELKVQCRIEKSTGSQSPWISPKLTAWRQKKLKTLRYSWFTLQHSASKIKFLQRKLKQTAPAWLWSFIQSIWSSRCLLGHCWVTGMPMTKFFTGKTGSSIQPTGRKKSNTWHERLGLKLCVWGWSRRYHWWESAVEGTL